MGSGMNMSVVRDANRRTVLSLIFEEGEMSRKDLAQAAGLTQASLTMITSGLIEEGILKECGFAENKGAGRKKVLLGINADYGLIAVMNIDREKTSVSLCDLTGRAREITSIPTGRDAGAFLKKAADVLQDMMKKHPERVLGLSAGVAGSVRSGISLKENGLWNEDVDLAGKLSARLSMPVAAENNVNAFLTGEKLFGNRKADNLLAVKWGPGLGSAIMINGRLYEGTGRPELGQMLDDEGNILEEKVGLAGLRKIKGFDQESFPDQCRQKKYDAVFDGLSTAIVNTYRLIRPDSVVLYGDLCMDERVCERLMEECIHKDPGMQDIMYHSSLVEKENYIGPAAVFIKERFFPKQP